MSKAGEAAFAAFEKTWAGGFLATVDPVELAAVFELVARAAIAEDGVQKALRDQIVDLERKLSTAHLKFTLLQVEYEKLTGAPVAVFTPDDFEARRDLHQDSRQALLDQMGETTAKLLLGDDD